MFGINLHPGRPGATCTGTKFFLHSLYEEPGTIARLRAASAAHRLEMLAAFLPAENAQTQQQKRPRQQQQQQHQHQPQRMQGQQGFGQQMQGQQGFGGQGMGGMQGQQGFGGQGMGGMQMGGMRSQMQGMQGGMGMVRLHCLLFDHFCLLMTACRARTWWACAVSRV